MPAAYAVVAGGCDWPLPRAVGRSNDDVIALRGLRQFRQLRYVSYVACFALDGTPALGSGYTCKTKTFRKKYCEIGVRCSGKLTFLTQDVDNT